MKINKFGNWLQIAASTGIVVGLILVGVQLKQNSDLLKIQLLYEESQRSLDLESRVIGENGAEVWAKSIKDPENLTLAEQRVMEALYWSLTEQMRATRMLSDTGLLEADEWRLRVDPKTEFWLGNRYAAAWRRNFSTYDSESLPPDLVEAINDNMADDSKNFTAEHMSRVMGRLAEK